MRIGILGTGTLAVGLGTAWARAGHAIRIGGRSREKAAAAAGRIGGAAVAVEPREAAAGADVVLVAVAWEGLADILALAGAKEGTLAGTPLLDPTNAVAHGVGELLTPDGRSAAEHLADLAPGAHVVKGFHLFAADQWQPCPEPGPEPRPEPHPEPGPEQRRREPAAEPAREPVTVVLAGDDDAALAAVSQLVADAGGQPAVLGPLRRARQLEEVAGFVIGLAFAGVDPASAVPHISLPAPDA
ncbi:NADPH-dependent F420 reductase [Actinacidiphila epipremni]|uniref:NAD(P)-binding domain-containing protein n=1 Tax=Actinacidiphila epipremni TaxID=2053013 RepID=A0ABX0ZDW1_9ACTN|nr:NAD(P)-binding domain-containing protein [Actinacidiphila epipremni]